MRCPTCGKAVSHEDNAFRPFCSERCKLIDLDNWLAERYRISTPVAAREKPGPSTAGISDAAGVVEETQGDDKADGG